MHKNYKTPQEITEIIKELMQKKGVSQSELANRTHYVRSTVSKQLKDGITNIETIRQYAEALHVPVTSIIKTDQGQEWEIIATNDFLQVDIGIKKRGTTEESCTQENN